MYSTLMEGKVPLLGMIPVAGTELELAVAHIGHPIAIDLHFLRDIGHPRRPKVQLDAVGGEPSQLEARWSDGLGTRPQPDHSLQHAQRIGHLALVVPELGDIFHLQLERGPVVGHEDAVIEAHNALAVVQPGERWRWLSHCVAAQVDRSAHIGKLHRLRLVVEPVGFICRSVRGKCVKCTLYHLLIESVRECGRSTGRKIKLRILLRDDFCPHC